MDRAIEDYAKDHDYENWLFDELVELCKSRGLKCTRTKSDLIERLVKDDTKFLNRLKDYIDKYGTDFSDSNVSKWLNRVNTCKMSTTQLKEQCKYRDICMTGSKSDLCKKISDYDMETINRMKRFVDRYM